MRMWRRIHFKIRLIARFHRMPISKTRLWNSAGNANQVKNSRNTKMLSTASAFSMRYPIMNSIASPFNESGADATIWFDIAWKGTAMRRAGSVCSTAAVSSPSRFRRLVLVVLPLFALLLGGCTARLTLPGAPAQPRAVVLLEHGNHSSLILTDAGAVPWRFAYGDWHWYVDGEHGPIAAARALLVPSRAAFGRRALRPRDPRLGWQPQVGSTITGEIAFAAESARVDALLARLQATFASAVTPPTDALHLQLEVVTDPVPYTLCHNSNHGVAMWLRETGVEVRGNPTFGRWRVVP